MSHGPAIPPCWALCPHRGVVLGRDELKPHRRVAVASWALWRRRELKVASLRVRLVEQEQHAPKCDGEEPGRNGLGCVAHAAKPVCVACELASALEQLLLLG